MSKHWFATSSRCATSYCMHTHCLQVFASKNGRAHSLPLSAHYTNAFLLSLHPSLLVANNCVPLEHSFSHSRYRMIILVLVVLLHACMQRQHEGRSAFTRAMRLCRNKVQLAIWRDWPFWYSQWWGWHQQCQYIKWELGWHYICHLCGASKLMRNQHSQKVSSQSDASNKVWRKSSLRYS